MKENQNVEKIDAEEVLISIKNELKNRERDCEILKEKFDKNFLNAYLWYGEEMCIQTIWVQQLWAIIDLINEGYEGEAVTIKEVFIWFLDKYETHLKNPRNVRQNSTLPTSTEVSTYEFKTYMYIKEFLLDLKKQYPKAF